MEIDIMNALITKVSEGSNIKIDLKNKRCVVNGIDWIIKGKKTTSVPDLPLWIGKDKNNILDTIEKAYKYYKYSYPDETETKKKYTYFKALTADEMTDEELVNGLNRKLTRITLEAIILFGSITGVLTWRKEWGTWYYQGKDKDLIILREWVE